MEMTAVLLLQEIEPKVEQAYQPAGSCTSSWGPCCDPEPR